MQEIYSSLRYDRVSRLGFEVDATENRPHDTAPRHRSIFGTPPSGFLLDSPASSHWPIKIDFSSRPRRLYPSRFSLQG